MIRRALCCLCALTIFVSCSKNPDHIEPKITLSIPQSAISDAPSPFPTVEAPTADWEKELSIGRAFAKEGDYYRAITSFKRARFLLYGQGFHEKYLQEIEYDLFLSYYLARRYEQAIETFDGSLRRIDTHFVAYKQLLCLLFDACVIEKRNRQAEAILGTIQKIDPTTAKKLLTYQHFMQGNRAALVTSTDELIKDFVNTFTLEQKSVHQSEILNALLPGAGYLYVGQIQSAITSFFINALFIIATVEFFLKGQPAAGLIAGGFEVGWYVGGIRGAGLAAKEYNNALWSSLAKQTLIQTRGCPLFMIEYGF